MNTALVQGAATQMENRKPLSRPGRPGAGGIRSGIRVCRVAKRLKLNPTLACRPLAMGALVLGTIELADRDIPWYFRDQHALELVPEGGPGIRPAGSRFRHVTFSFRVQEKCIEPTIGARIFVLHSTD